VRKLPYSEEIYYSRYKLHSFQQTPSFYNITQRNPHKEIMNEIQNLKTRSPHNTQGREKLKLFLALLLQIASSLAINRIAYTDEFENMCTDRVIKNMHIVCVRSIRFNYLLIHFIMLIFIHTNQN
jgi:hypothetical protein